MNILINDFSNGYLYSGSEIFKKCALTSKKERDILYPEERKHHPFIINYEPAKGKMGELEFDDYYGE